MNTSLIELTAAEQKLAGKIDQSVTNQLTVSGAAGGLGFRNAEEVMTFAKLMALSHVAIPKHLRGNPGACLAVTIQAIEWRLSPYAVANKSYSVNDRLAYKSQLIQAVILQRAPIKGRFRFSFSGDGVSRKCKVEVTTNDGEVVDYETPEIKDIPVKNSPLWKGDPDQQLTYYAGRALCRRHFPDVLLGVYDRDEAEGEPRDPAQARDVTQAPRSLSERLDALANAAPAEPQADEYTGHDPDTGEVKEAATNDAATGKGEVMPQAAAGGAHPLGIPSELRRESNEPPKRPEDYIATAKAYIADADDADWLETRWREEKQLRQRLGVPVSDAKVLGDAVLAKAKELRTIIAGDAPRAEDDQRGQ